MLDEAVVPIVFLDDKVPVVPLEVMSDDIDLSCVIVGQGIQPFQKVPDTGGTWERLGFIVVFGFGHDEIGKVFFLGLHGFNIKEDV